MKAHSEGISDLAVSRTDLTDKIIKLGQDKKQSQISQYESALGRSAKFEPEHINAEAEQAKAENESNPLTGSSRWQQMQEAAKKDMAVTN